MEDKTCLSFCPDLAPELRRLRPDLMFESSIEKTVGNRKKVENSYYLVEIPTPWTYEGTNGSALITAYQKKVRKYQTLIAEIERKKPGHKCIQATVIVSPTGALLRESQEEFAKVSKLARGKLRKGVSLRPPFREPISSGANSGVNSHSPASSKLFIQVQEPDTISQIQNQPRLWAGRSSKTVHRSALMSALKVGQKNPRNYCRT
jgi:hypothetical protein